jgi:hypothetical protein
LTGIPFGLPQSVLEDKNLSYAIRLTEGLTTIADVFVHLHATSTHPKLTCASFPPTIRFLPTSSLSQQVVHIHAQGNRIDEGTDAIVYTCEITHTAVSTDPQYAGHPSRVVTLDIINDDEANLKIWTADEKYSMKFLSLFVGEGEAVEYGLGVDAEPTLPIVIRPNSSLTIKPSALVFNASNWKTIQWVTVTAAKDDIDADGGVFHIRHPMTTSDAIFYHKATAQDTLVTLQVKNDDTAGIQLAGESVLLFRVGEETAFRLERLHTIPFADVTITIVAPSFIVCKPAVFVVSPAEWKSINQSLVLHALPEAKGESISVELHATSEDPKYNMVLTVPGMVLPDLPTAKVSVSNGLPMSMLIELGIGVGGGIVLVGVCCLVWKCKSRKDVDKVDSTLEEGVSEEWEKIDFSYLKQRFPRPVRKNPLQKDKEKLDFSIPGMPRGVKRQKDDEKLDLSIPGMPKGVKRGGKRARSGPTRKQIERRRSEAI